MCVCSDALGDSRFHTLLFTVYLNWCSAYMTNTHSAKFEQALFFIMHANTLTWSNMRYAKNHIKYCICFHSKRASDAHGSASLLCCLFSFFIHPPLKSWACGYVTHLWRPTAWTSFHSLRPQTKLPDRSPTTIASLPHGSQSPRSLSCTSASLKHTCGW